MHPSWGKTRPKPATLILQSQMINNDKTCFRLWRNSKWPHPTFDIYTLFQTSEPELRLSVWHIKEHTELCSVVHHVHWGCIETILHSWSYDSTYISSISRSPLKYRITGARNISLFQSPRPRRAEDHQRQVVPTKARPECCRHRTIPKLINFESTYQNAWPHLNWHYLICE